MGEPAGGAGHLMSRKCDGPWLHPLWCREMPGLPSQPLPEASLLSPIRSAPGFFLPESLGLAPPERARL